MYTTRACLLLGFLLLGPVIHASPIYYFVAAGHTSAQTQIDVSHSSNWTFTPDQDFLLGGGKLLLKAGKQTSTSTTLELVESLVGGVVSLKSVTLTATQFCDLKAAFGDNCQTFGKVTNTVPYQFDTAVTLYKGRTYTVTLTAPQTPDKQSQAYFIKQDSIGFFDASGNPLPPPPPPPPDPPQADATPEPATWLLVVCGAPVALWRLKRARNGK